MSDVWLNPSKTQELEHELEQSEEIENRSPELDAARAGLIEMIDWAASGLRESEIKTFTAECTEKLNTYQERLKQEICMEVTEEAESAKSKVSPPKYDVHIYAVVRVKVADIAAESQKAAIKQTDESLDLHSVFKASSNHQPGIVAVEYAEEIVGFLVDEVGDSAYQNTKMYDVIEGELVRSQDKRRKGDT